MLLCKSLPDSQHGVPVSTAQGKETDRCHSEWEQLVEKLLRHGANPNQLQPEGITPFHYAVGQQDSKNPELTRLFLEYGADPNVRSTQGMTPLHVAATWGNLDCLRLLLLNGGDPALKDEDDMDCFDLASQYDNKDCVELLLDFMTETPEDGCCRYTIVPYDEKECLSFLLEEESPFKPDERTIIKPRHRNTSMYTQDINNLLSSYLLDEECAKDMIFDVTSPSHPYIETRKGAKERATDEHLPQYRSDKSADITDSSEDSFVTCTSQNLENNTYSGGDGQSQSKQNHSPKKSYRVSSLKFSPLTTSLPSVSVIAEKSLDCRDSLKKSSSNISHDASGFYAAHMCENVSSTSCVTCGINRDLDMNNSCDLSQSQQQCVSSYDCWATGKSHCSQLRSSRSQGVEEQSRQQDTACQHRFTRDEYAEAFLEKQFTGISLQDEVPSPKLCSELEQNTQSGKPVKPNNPIHPDSNELGLPDSDDTSSLFSHISVLPPDLHCNSSATHHKSTLSSCHHQRGDNSSIPGEEDSLADFIPDEFNLSDLTINTNNSHKSGSGRHPGQFCHRNRERCSLESAVSSTSTINYVYSDPEEGITLIERHGPSSIHSGRTSLESGLSSQTQDLQDSDNDTVLYSWEDYLQITPNGCRHSPRGPGQTNTPDHSEDSEATLVLTTSSLSDCKVIGDATPDIPAVLKRLSNVELKKRLVSLGDEPGPVTPSTRQTYLIRLMDLQNNPDLSRLALTTDKPGYSSELRHALSGMFSYAGLEETETRMVEPFQRPRADRKWREGVLKSSFNYLLLDPRVAQNLPTRAQILGDLETFKIFISAIFYIGKGKRSRPYCHLYEAIKHRKSPQIKKPSEKVQKILDVWSEGLGVISLHIFQNVIPVEAYTREACMVDAMGLNNLTNKKRGDYYGPSSTWPANQRRKVGVHLLKKALCIFLAEGERQICPPDIGVGQ
ncbi:uncharacterized protein LOC135473770 isoform X2 [Liolophura sinensis]